MARIKKPRRADKKPAHVRPPAPPAASVQPPPSAARVPPGSAAPSSARDDHNDDDMDWEDEVEVDPAGSERGDGSTAAADAATPTAAGAQPGVITVCVPRAPEGAHEVIDLEAEPEVDAPRRKRRRQPTRDEAYVATELHRTHLLALLAHARACSRACDGLELRARLLSLLPEAEAPPVVRTEGAWRDEAEGALPSVRHLERLVRWLRSAFAEERAARSCPPAAAWAAAAGEGTEGGGATAALLERALEARVAPAALMHQLLVALARALGAGARWVQPLRPLTPKAATRLLAARADDGGGGGAAGDAGRELGSGALPDAQGWAEIAVATGAAGASDAPPFRWVHVDAARNVLDHPAVYHTPGAAGAAADGRGGAAGGGGGGGGAMERFAFVCAFTPRCATDVTVRYVRQWADVPRMRSPDDGWWPRALDAASACRAAREVAEAADSAEFARRRAAQPLPSTLAALRESGEFVLARDLEKAKTRAARPDARAHELLVRGRPERVFRKKDVAELKSAEGWYRHGRQVRREEVGAAVSAGAEEGEAEEEPPHQLGAPPPLPPLAPPAESAGGAGGCAGDGGGGGGGGGGGLGLAAGGAATAGAAMRGTGGRLGPGDSAWYLCGGLPSAAGGVAAGARLGATKPSAAARRAARPLYGQWQTEPLRVPSASGGAVPRNRYGVVDVLTPAHLPEGTVHVRLPRAAQVARALGIDYAPAKVGFEWHGGSATPRFEGVVVCAEHAETVADAHAALTHATLEGERAKVEQEAAQHWRALLRALSIHLQLRRDYGDGAGGATPAAPRADAGRGDAPPEMARASSSAALALALGGEEEQL